MDSWAWCAHAGGRGVAVATLASVLLLGCGGGDEEPSDPPRATTSGSTSPADGQSPSRSVPPGGEDPSDRCARSQRNANGDLEWPLLQVIWLLTSDVDGRSTEASNKAAAALERAVAKVRRACSTLPDEMSTLQSDVRTATAAPLDAPRLGDLEDAFARWAQAIGRRDSPMQGAVATLRHCNQLADWLRAGYALWWDYTPDGKRWWVQILVENDTDKRYWLDLLGTMRVTGQTYPNRGRRRIGWGGSSADSMYAYPSTTSTRRVGLTEFVETTAEGFVSDVRPEVLIYHQGHSCSLPVPRLN